MKGREAVWLFRQVEERLREMQLASNFTDHFFWRRKQPCLVFGQGALPDLQKVRELRLRHLARISRKAEHAIVELHVVSQLKTRATPLNEIAALLLPTFAPQACGLPSE